MLFFNIFNTSNDKYPLSSNMLNLKKLSTKTVAGLPKKIKNKRFFIPSMYLFLICLSFLSHFRLPSSLFSVPWFSVVRLSGSWSDGFRLWSDGRWPWVVVAMVLWSAIVVRWAWVVGSTVQWSWWRFGVGRGSPMYWVFVCVMGFGSPIWWSDGFCFLWVLVHRSTGDGEGGFFFFLVCGRGFGSAWVVGHQSTGFVCVMGFGLPIWFDGFWFGVLCWWVQIEVAGVVGFGCGLCCRFFFFLGG